MRTKCQPWLVAPKVTHDRGSHKVIINGDGTVQTISVKPWIGPRGQLPEVRLCYNFVEGLTNQEVSIYVESKRDLLPIRKFTLLKPSLPDSSTESFEHALT